MSINIVLCNKDGEFVRSGKDGFEITRYPNLAQMFNNPYVAEKEVIKINSDVVEERKKFFINFYKTMYVFALNGDDKLLLRNNTDIFNEETDIKVSDMVFGPDLRLAVSFSLLPDANEFGNATNSLLVKSKVEHHIEVVETTSLDNHFGFCNCEHQEE